MLLWAKGKGLFGASYERFSFLKKKYAVRFAVVLTVLFPLVLPM